MANWLERLLGRTDPERSSQQAKARLQFVLLHERLSIEPDKLDAMKAEILDVIRKYISVDDERFDIALQRRESASLLVAEVPFLRAAAHEPDENNDAGRESNVTRPKRDTQENAPADSDSA